MPRLRALLAAGIITIGLLPVPLSAQTTQEPGTNEVFAPFVSRLRIGVADPRVRISWQDTPDAEGEYRIYRHIAQISERNFDNATLVGSVDGGVQQFTDAPPEPGEYYYAVIATDEEGTEYELFIGFRNVTTTPVSITAIATEEQQAAEAESISAELAGESILVRFSAPQVGRRMVVLRANEPIVSLEDVANAMTVATVTSSERRVFDRLIVPGVPYHYAVLDESLVASGEVVVETGRNSTQTAVEIPVSAAAAESVAVTLPAAQSVRRTPLPFLRLESSLTTGEALVSDEIQIPEPTQISEVTDKALTVLDSYLTSQKSTQLEAVVLPEEQDSGLQGPAATLASIVTGAYSRLEWEAAEGLLTNFLTLPLEKDVAARARFYRGITLYFQEQPEAAFMDLLLAEPRYYSDVQPWLEAILSGPAG